MNMRGSKSPMAMGVTYDRAESPATRRKSSGQPPPNSRQGSFVGQYARQWESPRGSVTSLSSTPRGSITCNTLPRSRSPSAPFNMSPRGSNTRVSSGHVTSKISAPSPLARDHSETNILPPGNKIRSQKMSKEDLLMPAVRSDPYEQLKVHNHNAVRSDSSCSLGKISVDLSNSELYSDRLGHVARGKDTCGGNRDVTSCDTSSEVSDEGYKSSQGNVSNKLEENSGQLEPQLDTADASQQERPESSMTVGSDCSSTISSEDDCHPDSVTHNSSSSSHVEDQDGSSSQTVISASPAK